MKKKPPPSDEHHDYEGHDHHHHHVDQDHHHHHGDHDHHHHHHALGLHLHLHDPTIANIRVAFFLNAGFALIEFIGAGFTNSVSIAADAVHDLGDSLALALAWILAYFANRMHTPLFTYGFHRLSLMGALVNTVVLFAGSIGTLFFAVPRLWSPPDTDSTGMLGLAILGVAINGYAVYRTSSGKSLNERAVSLHLLEDVLGWVAVAVTSVVMIFTDFVILDPILSILIVIYILWRVVKNLKATILLFLQACPENIQTPEIEKILSDHKLVQDVHDVHIWSLDGDKHVLSSHVVVSRKTTKEVMIILKIELKERLRELGIGHSTLEFEYEDEKCQIIDSC